MYKYLLYFLIFSFFGWCTEVVFCFFKTGRLVNRGLAKGPVCPIYGLGICLSSLLLSSVRSFFLLALLSMAIATIVEFAVGIITHKITGHRLWDYSREKGNILGYVCPRFSLIWGVVSAAVIRLLSKIDPIINFLDTPILRSIAFAVLTLIIVDSKNEMLKKERTDWI